MSIACLLVPSLALACELAERPALHGQPVALSDASGLRVADATREAARRGVRPGMTLREATAYCPALSVLEPRPARVARALERLAAALGTVSPLIETPPLESAGVGIDALYADLRGTERLFPRPVDLERAIFGALAAAGALPAVGVSQGRTEVATRSGALAGALRQAQDGLRPRVSEPSAGRSVAPDIAPKLGIAERRFTAHAAARSAPPGVVQRIAASDAASFLAVLPAAWLPLPVEAVEHLRLLGIRTIGAFVALPRHAVEAQFGPVGGRAWLAASGEDLTPVCADPVAGERVIEHVQAEPPLVSREAVRSAAEQLLSRALRHPRVRRRFVRSLRLRAVTEDDRLWERVQTLKEPTGDRARLWITIRPLLEHAEYPGPIAELELELGGLTAESARQTGLFTDRARRREQLDEMVRHLKLRYGQSPVMHMVGIEPWSRIPERRYALMDYDP